MSLLWPRLAFAAGVLLALLLQGCATHSTQALQSHWPPELPERAEVQGTPFIEQGEQECGPASLAMVMRHAGVAADVATLKPQVYLPGRQGSLQLELPAAARRAGLAAYKLPPRIDALLLELSRGHPVLIFQNLGLSWLPVWHYAVLTGYDRERQQLRLHSGPKADDTLSMDTFERTWARGDRWAMVVLDASQLPASVEAKEIAAALSRLERLHPAQARRGYAAALQRWPAHAVLLSGAGSTAHAAGDMQAAEQAFERLVREHPTLADGWHNLAQTRLDLGRLALARDAARQATQRGGPRQELYESLLARIEQQLTLQPSTQTPAVSNRAPRAGKAPRLSRAKAADAAPARAQRPQPEH